MSAEKEKRTCSRSGNLYPLRGPNACIESFVSSPCEEMEETTCTYDLVCPEGHAKESQGFPLRGNRDSSHGGDVSHAKLARVKHASPMKQEPTEVILQDE